MMVVNPINRRCQVTAMRVHRPGAERRQESRRDTDAPHVLLHKNVVQNTGLGARPAKNRLGIVRMGGDEECSGGAREDVPD